MLLHKKPAHASSGRDNAITRENSSLNGFTLLEILIALFVFTIIAIIITSALHNMINNQTRIEKNATRFAELETAMLLISRDFEQVIERPITLSNGAIAGAFIGTPDTATFTHAGFVNPLGLLPRSTLQRVSYRVEEGKLLRETGSALDQGVLIEPSKRVLLTQVTQLQFAYLDPENKFHTRWPPAEKAQQTTPPRAVSMIITLGDLGKIKQLYIIPVQKIEKPI